MIIMEHGNVDKQVPNQGAWDIHVAGQEKYPLVVILCPKCQKVSCLRNHTIHRDGTVSPSLVCPRDECNFHEMIKLKDWKGLPQKL